MGATKFADVFGALAAPFHHDDVKRRKMPGGRMCDYITARTAMNRLDDVLGPENWWDEYDVVRDNAMVCRLTVRLPDGSMITKQGVGVTSASVGEDAEKGAESDSLKRAATKFGVARYLYNDGVPDYSAAEEPVRPAHPVNGSGHGRGQYASPEQVRTYVEKRDGYLGPRNQKWLDRWTGRDGLLPGVAGLCNGYQADGHLLKWAVETGRLDGGIVPEDAKSSQKAKYVAIVYHRSTPDRRALAQELERYMDEQAERKAEALYRRHPDLRPAEDDDGRGAFVDELEETEAGVRG